MYRLSVIPFTRSKGHNVVAKAAYRAGTTLQDRSRGQSFSYDGKSVDLSEIRAPEFAPEWMKDRAELWNTVEEIEVRKNARLAREFQIALPRELSEEAQVLLLRAWVDEQLVGLGMVADVAIHREHDDNPHAHVMVANQIVTPNGFGGKRREWNDLGLLRHWRESWMLYANRALAQEGSRTRIDHRSYAKRGIDLQPQPKLYRRLDEVDGDSRDVVRDRLALYRKTARQNGRRIVKDPTIALQLLTEQEATFTDRDVAKLLNRFTDEEEQFQTALAAVLSSPHLVQVGVDEDGRTRFTTVDMMERERQLVEAGAAMAARGGYSVKEKRAKKVLKKFAKARGALSEEQEAAFLHIVVERRELAVIEGIAGSGKSHMLAAARLAWEAEGHRVFGAALAGKAAGGLQEDAGIDSKTIAAWEFAWAAGRKKLRRGDVLVVDEAGMVGTVMMAQLLKRADKVGAKVVLVGDSQQLQAISAGSPLRALGDRVGCARMAKVRRQKVEWQAAAAENFFGGEADAALRTYLEHGRGHAAISDAAAREALVAKWSADCAEDASASRLIMAFRRDDVRALNALCREDRRQKRELGRSRKFVIEGRDGPENRDFAVGERLYFLKNSDALGVSNGSLGTLRGINGNLLQVELDAGRTIEVDVERYKAIDHGYAATVHKAQGVTVDQAYVLAGGLFDQHSTYVALSRHRSDAHLFWSESEFSSRDKLLATLGRKRQKGLVSDVAPSPVAEAELDTNLSVEQRFLALRVEDQEEYLRRLDRLVTLPSLTPQEAMETLSPVIKAREAARAAFDRKQALIAERENLKGELGARKRRKPPEWKALQKELEDAIATSGEADSTVRGLLTDEKVIVRAAEKSKEHNRAGAAAYRQTRFLRGAQRRERLRSIEPWLAEARVDGDLLRAVQPSDTGTEAVYVGSKRFGELRIGVFRSDNNGTFVMDLTGQPAAAGITQGDRVKVHDGSELSLVGRASVRDPKKERDR